MWQSMWERDEEWYKKAKEFYIEVNETKPGNKYREGVWGDRPAPGGRQVNTHTDPPYDGELHPRKHSMQRWNDLYVLFARHLQVCMSM